MKKLSLVTLLGLTAASIGTANATLIKTADLGKYCSYEKSPRQTVIYLDQNVIAQNDNDWYKDLVNKLDYLPSERMTIAKINSDSRVEELFSGCYPKVSNATMKRLKANKGFLDADPKKVIQDDQKQFKMLLFRAFSTAMKSSGNASKPKYSLSSLPKKSLVEAMYYDATRLELSNGISRVVIYSDMAENSSLYTPKKKAIESARKASERFPVSYANAEVYAYGVGNTFKGSDAKMNYKTFWAHYLNFSGAELKSFQQQLPPKKAAKPFDVRSYKGVMDLDGRKIALSLRLAKLKGQSHGNITSSFFAVKDDLYPITGTYSCKGDACNIEATLQFTDADNSSFKKGDLLNIKGKFGGQLTGSVGSVDDTETTVTGNKFQYKVAFDADSILSF